MEPWWLKHAGEFGKAALVAGFLLFGVWETVRSGRIPSIPAGKRWLLHCLLLILVGATTYVVLPISAVALAVGVSGSSHGLLNRTSLPFALRALLAVLLLDFVHYANHYLMHRVPLLWRFHQTHHSDRDLDLSTGVRFHPGEALFTQGTYLLVIAAVAPPASVVLLFELCGVLQAFFSHANLVLPPRVEKLLRWVQVTPEMHRIHHSIEAQEQGFNLAVLFSFWDRLFRTYRDVPQAGEENLIFGLEEVSAADSIRPLAMLALPFVGRPQPAEPAASASSAVTLP